MADKLLLFGIPLYKTKIDSNSFDKKFIIKTIKSNYKIDPNRNTWATNSSLHHTYEDWENKKFQKIDLSSLMPIYTKTLENWTKENFCKPVSFNFSVENVTCMSKNQFMGSHRHVNRYNDVNFTAIHYLKFNPDSSSTLYENPADYSNFLDSLLEVDNLRCLYEKYDIESSWLFKNWYLNLSEDDFVIAPAILEHSVLKNNSDKLRITIVLNITIQAGD
jgi:hypothetical protein